MFLAAPCGYSMSDQTVDILCSCDPHIIVVGCALSAVIGIIIGVVCMFVTEGKRPWR